jgi:hypothetical protein
LDQLSGKVQDLEVEKTKLLEEKVILEKKVIDLE